MHACSCSLSIIVVTETLLLYKPSLIVLIKDRTKVSLQFLIYNDVIIVHEEIPVGGMSDYMKGREAKWTNPKSSMGNCLKCAEM